MHVHACSDEAALLHTELETEVPPNIFVYIYLFNFFSKSVSFYFSEYNLHKIGMFNSLIFAHSKEQMADLNLIKCEEWDIKKILYI